MAACRLVDVEQLSLDRLRVDAVMDRPVGRLHGVRSTPHASRVVTETARAGVAVVARQPADAIPARSEPIRAAPVSVIDVVAARRSQVERLATQIAPAALLIEAAACFLW